MNDQTVRQKKGSQQAATQIFLPISEIRDSVVILKNGGLRSILQTSSVNFNLKSEDEQNALIYSFQGFLNTIEFPIQILVRSRKLNVDTYLDNLSEIEKKQENPLMKKQTQQYMEYVKKLVDYADIMEKSFFVIVPFDPMRARSSGGMFSQFWAALHPKDSLEAIRQRHREFAALKKDLNNRVNLVKSGLSNCNLRAKELNTQQLVELFFQIYNPQTARNQNLKNMDNIGSLNLMQ